MRFPHAAGEQKPDTQSLLGDTIQAGRLMPMADSTTIRGAALRDEQERIMTAQERYGQREIMRGIVCRATGLLQERPCHAGIMNASDLSHDAGLLGEVMAFGRAV